MDEDLNKPILPPVNPDTKKVIIGIQPNINGGVIYLDGQDEGLGYAPKEIEFTIKELFTPREISIVKEGTISNDVYRIQSIEKINEKKTDTDLIFTYYDIIVDKLQEDGSYVQDQYITPVVDGVLDRTANEYVRLNYTLEEIPPPPPPPDSGIIFETNFPEDLSLFYEITGEDAKPIPSTSNQSQAIEFPIIDENSDDPRSRIKEIRIFSTSDLSEYTFNVFRLVRGDTITNFENEALVGLVEEELLTFQIEAVKTPPPPPVKKTITIFGDVVGENLIGYRLSNGVEGFVQLEEQQLEFEVSEETGNYIQFFNASDISYSDYVVNFDITNGNTNRQTNVFDFTEELTNNNVNISVVLTRASQSPPPNAPKIILDQNNYEYNINDDSDLEITFDTENADFIEYTISDIRRTVSVNSPITISNFDFNKGIGQYKIKLQPISDENGSGEIQSVVVNVVEKAYIPGPDIQSIDYPGNIQAEDFIGFNVPFDIVVQSINTNYIDIYVSKVDSQFLVRKNASPNGKISLNISDIFKKSKINLGDIQDKVQFDLILIPYNSNGDRLTSGREENISIFFDRGLRIKREDLVKDIRTAFEKEFDTSIIEVDFSKFLTHQLHLGNGDNRIISTWGVDTNTFDQDSLVLKLYEPLPPNISTETQVWISKLQSIPIIDEIEMVDEEVKVCTPLQPNFNLDIVDPIGYEVIDSLIASGSTSTNELISTYISSSEFSLEDLNITFTTGSGSSVDYNWSDFVKYSSAEERVNNFWYKVRILESYETDISNLSSGSSWTGSVEVLNEKRRIQTKINTLKSGFDSFEKYLYETTGSLTYPKNGLTPKPSTDQESQDWYYLTASISAQQYDRNNYDSLVNNIPLHVKNNDNGQEFVLFFSMIGQHFDILWQYTKGINKARKLEHKKNEGIADELVYHMLESLGWDADIGVSSQFLWQYAFGNDENGNKTTSLSGKERQQEIWRRLLNNLPYLLKHKGTKRALHAAMSCYGIPSSLLTIMEFGGPQASQQSSTTKTTFDDRTAALNFNQSSSILLPWNSYNDGTTTDYPNSIEMRIITSEKSNQNLLLNDGNWSVDIIKTTGSLAYLQMSISESNDLRVFSSSQFPFFNDEYTQIVVQRDYSGSYEEFNLYAKEGFQGRIRNETTASLLVTASNWESGSELVIGGGLTGSMDEFRLWRVPLNEQSIENHTLIPDAIDGNSYTASTEDLLFRMDFEYPRNLSVSSSSGIPSGSIKNVSINQNYLQSYNLYKLFSIEDPNLNSNGVSLRITDNYIVIAGTATSNKVPYFSVYDKSGNLITTGSDPAGPNTGNGFGQRLAATDEYVVVSATSYDGTFDNEGLFYIFDIDGNLLHTINNPTPKLNAYFPTSVAMHGDNILVGSIYDEYSGVTAGRAYLYSASTGNLIYTLNDSSPKNFGFYGESVSISEKYMVVSSGRNSTTNNIDGRAHVYDVSSGNLLYIIENPTPANDDFFGFRVDNTDEYIAITSIGEDDVSGIGGGAVYVFDTSNGNLVSTLVSPVYGNNQGFGRSVRIDGNTVIAGMYPFPYDTIRGIVGVYEASSGNLIQTLQRNEGTSSWPQSDLGMDVSNGIISITDIENDDLYIWKKSEYATAINFPTNSTYPFNYNVYDRTVVANVPSTGISFGQKFRFEEQVKIGDLSHKSRSTKRSFDTSPIDSDKLGLFFSPIKEINMDILKSLGNFNIDNYIGNPTDRYEDGYKDLKNLRNYYFDRFNLNLYEYIQLVRYIDKTIFTTLESLVPARAKVSKGLLIEPHLLERSKVQWKRPSALKNDFGTIIDVNEDVVLTSETNDIGGTIETVTDIFLSSDIKNYETNLVIDDIVLPSSEKLNYDSTIEVNNEVIISSSYSTFTTDIDSRNTTNLSGNITINSGSDMGGISISVDAKIEGNLSSEYESDAQIQAGLGTDSPFVVGFGLYGTDGVSIRTFYDKNNNLVQERVKVFQITEEYTQKIPQNINQFDPSLGKEEVSVTKTREKVTILPFTGSDGNESTDISVGGNITKVTPLNGYLPSHFRYVGDRTTGLENSFSKGSKQRASTTVDGSSPVETFTTNPNTLKVSDTGRGSGEPILEVD